MKKILSLIVALIMIFSVVACGDKKDDDSAKDDGKEAVDDKADDKEDAGDKGDAPAPSGDTFLIGVYTQMSGNNAEPGMNAKNGIDLAVKKVNEEGGFNGQQVAVEYYDTTGSTEEAVKVSSKNYFRR